MKLLESNFSIFYAMVSKLTEFKALTKLLLMLILISTINTNNVKVLFFPYWVCIIGDLIKGIVHVNSYLVCFLLVALR